MTKGVQRKTHWEIQP